MHADLCLVCINDNFWIIKITYEAVEKGIDMNKVNATEETVVLDRVEATSAKRVKGMPYVLGLSTAAAVILIAVIAIL